MVTIVSGSSHDSHGRGWGLSQIVETRHAQLLMGGKLLMAHQVALVKPSRGFPPPGKAAAVALLLLQVSRQLSNAKVP